MPQRQTLVLFALINLVVCLPRSVAIGLFALIMSLNGFVSPR